MYNDMFGHLLNITSMGGIYSMLAVIFIIYVKVREEKNKGVKGDKHEKYLQLSKYFPLSKMTVLIIVLSIFLWILYVISEIPE